MVGRPSTDPRPPPEPPDVEQATAAKALRGGVLVLAPVGSGKTRVLADRVVEAVREGFAPGRMLCVTFTNRAADEMRARVRAVVGDAARVVHVSTFHALCARILRREHRRLGLPQDFVVLDESDCDDLLVELGVDRGRGLEEAREDLHRAKAACPVDVDDARLSLDVPPETLFAGLPPDRLPYLVRYQALLADRQALDFDDLVRLVRALFRGDPEAAASWAGRYDLVQVDEVQDVHHGEYEVVRHLARRAGNLALIGDVDQTIYGWRGSDPDGVLALFRRDFGPVREIALRWNHRATRRLVEAANAVLEGVPDRRTRVEASARLDEGEPIRRHDAEGPEEEARWVAEQVRAVASERSLRWGRIGILCRTKARAQRVGSALAEAAVPHVTVEEFEFFRRQEVKDAMALLRLLVHPDDVAAADRALRRPARGFGDAALSAWRTEGAAVGLRLCDALSHETLAAGDPFGPLLADLDGGSLVVLDVETTGLDAASDEVLEVGAVRLDAGREAASFHALVSPTGSVGASGSVHGISDAELREKGRPAAEAFAELAAFVGDRAVVGHNVQFDVGMLEHHGARVGVPLRFRRVDDTLRLARRLHSLPRYDLASCLARFELAGESAHRALPDARAAAALLGRLAQDARAGAFARRGLVARVPDGVRALAATLASLREAASTARPAALLGRAVIECGLRDHYGADAGRIANLRHLWRVLRERDREDTPPGDALREAVLFASLAKNVSMEVADEGRVPVVTVHQAKGLEFDVVFLVGAVEGEFPSWRSRREGGERLEEERRLFYVGVTRARRTLYVSTHARNDRGFPCRSSPYLRGVVRPEAAEPRPEPRYSST